MAFVSMATIREPDRLERETDAAWHHKYDCCDHIDNQMITEQSRVRFSVRGIVFSCGPGIPSVGSMEI